MRVSLIEDESATAQSIAGSFNVYTTDLGEEGIDLGKIYDYDIILLDLNLPDMSGFYVLRKLQRAYQLLTELPEDFFRDGRNDIPPQTRKAL